MLSRLTSLVGSALLVNSATACLHGGRHWRHDLRHHDGYVFNEQELLSDELSETAAYEYRSA